MDFSPIFSRVSDWLVTAEESSSVAGRQERGAIQGDGGRACQWGGEREVRQTGQCTAYRSCRAGQEDSFQADCRQRPAGSSCEVGSQAVECVL